MIATLLLAPLFACIAIYLFRKKADIIAIAGAFVSLSAAILLAFTVRQGGAVHIAVAGLPDMPFRLLADNTSVVFLVVVAVVAFCIFLYGQGYMADEKGKVWFWAGMCLFLASMQLLVLSGDWILFITGWELMGFASYLLIGTWHWKNSAQEGASKAFMLTRFTDMGLYIGAFVIILTTGTSQITDAPLQDISMPDISMLGALALLVAVMGKSAQVPFQSWLSGAMAGPTPVSALLHSATMVAAGAILLLRAFPLLPEASLLWIGAVGGITILLTGFTAIVSKDVKQMLAASTSSQLGFMLLAIGAGFPGAAFAHWVAHAFMKSSLFLGAGVFQHARDSTAFDTIGGVGKKLKISFAAFAIAGVALAGIPPFIGYWSKDGILAAGIDATPVVWYFPVAVIGAFFTAMYMGRAIRILWKGQAEINRIQKINWMRTGLVALVLVVAAGGLFLEPVVQFAAYEIPQNTMAQISGIAAALAGLAAGWLTNTVALIGKPVHFLQNNYQLSSGYQGLVAKPALQLAVWCDQADKYLHKAVLKTGGAFVGIAKLANIIDLFGNYCIGQAGKFGLRVGHLSRSTEEAGTDWIARLTSSVKSLGTYGKKLQTGMVHQELVWSVGGMVICIIILIFSIR